MDIVGERRGARRYRFLKVELSISIRHQKIEMGSSARRPRLPKRSVIEKLTKKGPECLPEMMGLLSCFKENNFNEARCQSNMRALSECVARQVSWLLPRQLLFILKQQSIYLVLSLIRAWFSFVTPTACSKVKTKKYRVLPP